MNQTEKPKTARDDLEEALKSAQLMDTDFVAVDVKTVQLMQDIMSCIHYHLLEKPAWEGSSALDGSLAPTVYIHPAENMRERLSDYYVFFTGPLSDYDPKKPI